MTPTIPLIFVRYAPGACGNFVISMIQTSSKVSSWNTTLDEYKNTTAFPQEFYHWFTQRFKNDLDNHVKHEPHHPYQLDFISAKHSRGDDLTIDMFIDNLKQHSDQHLLKNYRNQTPTVLRLHKSKVPSWAINSQIVNIVIDKKSKKLVNRLRYHKLFGQENGYFISKENHPDFLKSKGKINYFNNQYQFDLPWHSFAKHVMINDPVLKLFYSEQNLLQHPSNTEHAQNTFYLSDLFAWTTAQRVFETLFQNLNLGQPNLELIYICWKHYYQTSLEPFMKVSNENL